MKNVFLFLGLLLSAFLGNAQNWQYDIDESKEIASREGKVIILVFQGSDWCAPCIKLEKEIWSNQEFISYANQHYVMLKADFPKKKANALSNEQQAKNGKLAEIYNGSGYFPFVVILDKNGKVLGNLGYEKVTPEEYIKKIQAFIPN